MMPDGMLHELTLRDQNIAQTATWYRFETAAREALAAGNELSHLRYTLDQQKKLIEDAKDALWVTTR
jgi:hypothetical protein